MYRNVPPLTTDLLQDWFAQAVVNGIKPDLETCGSIAECLNNAFLIERQGELKGSMHPDANLRVDRYLNKNHKRIKESFRVLKHATEYIFSNSNYALPESIPALTSLLAALSQAEPFISGRSRPPGRPGRKPYGEPSPWFLLAVVSSTIFSEVLVEIGNAHAGMNRNSRTVRLVELLLRHWGHNVGPDSIAKVLASVHKQEKTPRPFFPPCSDTGNDPNGEP